MTQNRGCRNLLHAEVRVSGQSAIASDIARLIKEKRMTAAGLKEIEMGQEDGRWEGAYDSPTNMQVPADFLRELKKSKNAYAFFQTLTKANTCAIAWRLQTAKKPETREKRMQALLQMLGQGKKLH